MAVLFCDGFDHYTEYTNPPKWDGQYLGYALATVVAGYGRFGNGGCETQEPRRAFYKNFDANYTTLIAGVACKFASSPTQNSGIINFYDSSTSQVTLFHRYSDSKLEVMRNGPSGTSLGISTNTLASGTWYYIEIKVYFHGSNGTVEVRVNGTSTDWINLTSQNTDQSGNGYANKIYFPGGPGYGSDDFYNRWDDFYICDDSGSRCNDFLGDVRIESIYPDGAGNYTQWTPSTGNNWDCVDETPPSESDYVYSITADQIDSYTHGSVTPTSGAIKAVAVWLYNHKDDAGLRTIQAMARHSSSDAFGDSKSVSDTWRYEGHIFEVNPSTSTDWTISEVNAAEFGMKIIA